MPLTCLQPLRSYRGGNQNCRATKMDLLIKYQQKLVEEVEPWGKQAVLIFRGQGNQKWKLDSSANRRLKNESKPPALIDGFMYVTWQK